MGKGHDAELHLKNAIIENTGDEITAMRPDYSGNSKHSVSDIRVTEGIERNNGAREVRDHFIEWKKRQGDAGKRTVVMNGSSQGDNGLDELKTLVTDSPPWAEAWLGVKFDHREAVIFNANDLATFLDPKYDVVYDNPHGVRLTDSGNISMVKPELADWPSATAGRPDWRVVMDEIVDS